MKGFWLAIAWLFAALVGPATLWAEDAPPADELLDKWQEAFEKCRTFEAKVTVFSYVWNPTELDETYEGHFYYEAPGSGRFQIKDQEYIWLHGDIFVAASGNTLYQQFTAAFVEATRQEVLVLERHGWSFFGGFKVGIYRHFAQPTGPVFLAPWRDRAEGWRERQKLTTEIHEGRLFLSGVNEPRRACEWREKWSVVIDPRTNMPWAIEQSTGGADRRVLVFSDIRVNEAPANRNQLLSLDHPEWKVELFDWLEEDGLRE